MPETKQDMSKTCGFSYQDNWTKANVTHEISQEEWKSGMLLIVVSVSTCAKFACMEKNS